MPIQRLVQFTMLGPTKCAILLIPWVMSLHPKKVLLSMVVLHFTLAIIAQNDSYKFEEIVEIPSESKFVMFGQ
jgi:hypothetical protein